MSYYGNRRYNPPREVYESSTVIGPNTGRVDPPIPEYRWVPGTPDKNGSTGGCNGCAFRAYTPQIRCSLIPCQRYPGMVAELVPAKQ